MIQIDCEQIQIMYERIRMRQILPEVLHIPVESGLALMKIELHVKLSNLILNTAYNRSPHSIPG